jgi:aspartyl-tRNA(Asn)/glutamyl-tRNA(Gln) amidotransferase subunit C
MAYSAEDVQKLAALARLSIPEERLPKLAAEFDAILGYVSQLDELTIDKRLPLLPYTNAFRADENPHESGVFTEKIAEQFPAREGDYLSVKQIISHD